MISEDVISKNERYLTFSNYLSACRSLISNKRTDLNDKSDDIKKLIIDSNSPFELYPDNSTQKRFKYGALLVHGLFDSPFSLKEIALRLKEYNIPSKALLLPGHGTSPKDLLSVSYRDWLNAVQYGISTFQEEVDNLFLIGYSTGAALALYHALQNSTIKGLILLSPAIKIRLPIDMILGYQQLKKYLSNEKEWVLTVVEDDYVKYRSFPFNPVFQVENLTEELKKLAQTNSLTCPALMILSKHDETISCQSAMDYFLTLKNDKNQLILYSEQNDKHDDQRITIRSPEDSRISIQHLSHVSVPFSPTNFHYGLDGDFPHAPHSNRPEHLYGAYNRVEIKTSDFLYKCGILKQLRRSLTYNPDFDFMIQTIHAFITK